MSSKRVFSVVALTNEPWAKLGQGVHLVSLTAAAPPLQWARDWAKEHSHPWHLMELAEFTSSGDLVLRAPAYDWEAELLCECPAAWPF